MFSNPYLSSLDPDNENKLQLSVFFCILISKLTTLDWVLLFYYRGSLVLEKGSVVEDIAIFAFGCKDM
jgi:hypothetical protein